VARVTAARAPKSERGGALSASLTIAIAPANAQSWRSSSLAAARAVGWLARQQQRRCAEQNLDLLRSLAAVERRRRRLAPQGGRAMDSPTAALKADRSGGRRLRVRSRLCEASKIA